MQISRSRGYPQPPRRLFSKEKKRRSKPFKTLNQMIPKQSSSTPCFRDSRKHACDQKVLSPPSAVYFRCPCVLSLVLRISLKPLPCPISSSTLNNNSNNNNYYLILFLQSRSIPLHKSTAHNPSQNTLPMPPSSTSHISPPTSRFHLPPCIAGLADIHRLAS